MFMQNQVKNCCENRMNVNWIHVGVIMPYTYVFEMFILMKSVFQFGVMLLD